MSNFAMIRLGKDSVGDIRMLDALHQSPATPIAISISCTQVPQELVAGDHAFFCLGSDNNKGIPTAWERGVRALGTVTSKTGGPGYNDTWVIRVDIKVVLPQSVGQKQLLARAPQSYHWCSGIPVLGVDTHSNQTVQMIKGGEPDQNVAALAYSLNSIFPSFRPDTSAAYPELESLFDYKPPSPPGAASSGQGPTLLAAGDELHDMVERFLSDAEVAGVHVEQGTAHRLFVSLLSKRFLIATGLAGSGKTQLAQALARWLTPPDSFPDPFRPGATLEAARKVYKVNDSDSLGVEFLSDEGTKVLLPRAIIDQWANYIEEHKVPDTIGAQELRDKIKACGGDYSPYLQNFETHYKPAVFALLKARGSTVPAKCYEVVPVGADWTGNENVLGYPNGLDNASYVTKPALDLILRAKDRPDVPFFLILDEMNLSHVERYFADILSAIESEETIQLHQDRERKPTERSCRILSRFQRTSSSSEQSTSTRRPTCFRPRCWTGLTSSSSAWRLRAGRVS